MMLPETYLKIAIGLMLGYAVIAAVFLIGGIIYLAQS